MTTCCGRCSGRMFLEQDCYGQEAVCWNCGARIAIDAHGNPIVFTPLPRTLAAARSEVRARRRLPPPAPDEGDQLALWRKAN